MKCTICNKESDKLVDWIPKWFSPYQCTESQLETGYITHGNKRIY